MPMSVHILAVLLDFSAGALLVYWCMGLARVFSTAMTVPTVRAGIALAQAGPPPTERVCVVIPAHNEEVSIEPLIRSLAAQDYPHLSVVFCLDRCTDATPRLARDLIAGDPRFTLIEIDHCPAGWAGKVHAVWTGTRSAPALSADYLLFIDADTVLEPACISAAVALLRERGLDLLSLLSTLSLRWWFEFLVQPVAGIELIRQYPISRANRPPGTRRRAFANGQFMLFRRSAYEAVGGHEAVKDELLEDLALARATVDGPGGSHGEGSAGIFLADGMLTCRMYESWRAFWNGWKRIYTEAARCNVGRLRRSAFGVAYTGTVLPLLAMVNLVWATAMLCGVYGPGFEWIWRGWLGAGLSGFGLLAWALVMAAAYRIGRVPLWAFPGSIVGSWLVGRVLAEAARDLERGVPTVWAGREYVRVPRES